MESEIMYEDLGKVPFDDYLIEIGEPIIRKRGKDLTLVSFGKMMKIGIDITLEMAEFGIDIELIDIRTVRPLHLDYIINSVKKTNHILIIEES
jgi:pyruvate dehydrogenase E1 component beta subunit